MIDIENLPFSHTHAFPSIFLDYIDQKDSLKPFYNRFPDLEAFKNQIAEKSAHQQIDRNLLHQTLIQQYGDIPLNQAVKDNIEQLKDNHTFTITTGHQLTLLTGPLYFIYKIVTTINACRQLKKVYPDYHFVPIFWMATEDHDYDEIKSFRLFEKTYTWHTDQQGAVGRFQIDVIRDLLQQIPCDVSVFEEAFQQHNTLQMAVRHYVNTLFGEEGLVIIDGDDASLKAQLRPWMKEDILQQSVQPIVEDSSAKLQAQGFNAQVNAREINFFYLDNDIRSRIEKFNDGYRLTDSSLKFSEQEMQHLIENEPIKLSPNVIMRPLYQEILLPNLAYVGGPGELAYWLQLKSLFQHFQIPFPILLPRNFAMVIDNSVQKRVTKTGLPIADFFLSTNELIHNWVLNHAGDQLSMATETRQFKEVYERLKHRAIAIDPTLEKFVGAMEHRSIQGLSKLELKLKRAIKKKQKDRVRQIEWIKEKLFPNGALQERTDNFLNFQATHPHLISDLLNHLDPFDFRFNLIYDDQNRTS